MLRPRPVARGRRVEHMGSARFLAGPTGHFQVPVRPMTPSKSLNNALVAVRSIFPGPSAHE